MRTIGSELDAHKGVGPGFDAVRLFLATAVLFIHTSLLPGAPGPETPIFPFAPIERWSFAFIGVPMFFALSGFLVSASAERLPVLQFVINRLLRIIPALCVAVLFATLVVGPLVTTWPLGAYFTDHRFATYFLNVFGIVRTALPGVFEGNPEHGVVNGTLWTVPHELACYAIMVALVLTGVFRRRWLLLAATVGLFAVAIVVFACGKFGIRLPAQGALEYAFVTRGAARLMPMFLTGMVFYRFRDMIPYRGEYAAIATLAYVAIASFGGPDWITNPIFNAAVAPLFAYVVIYFGLSESLSFEALKGGDYSYGVYLYGFPIQQSIILALPGLTNVWLFFLLSAVGAFAMAMVSWRYVEKPILGLRKRFSVAARVHTAPGGAAQPAPAPAKPLRRKEEAFG